MNFPVEVSKAQERLHVFDRGRHRPVQNRCDFGRIHADAGWRDHVSDKGHLLLVKLTLLHLCIQIVVPHNLQNAADMLHMLGGVFREDDDVI